MNLEKSTSEPNRSTSITLKGTEEQYSIALHIKQDTSTLQELAILLMQQVTKALTENISDILVMHFSD